jgi:hypothetical protein
MHVVPTVEMKPRTALDTFKIEAGLEGNPARRQIVHRMRQFQPVESDDVERPASQGLDSPGCDILSASRWHRPIRYLALTTRQGHTLQRNPAKQTSGNRICDSPQ